MYHLTHTHTHTHAQCSAADEFVMFLRDVLGVSTKSEPLTERRMVDAPPVPLNTDLRLVQIISNESFCVKSSMYPLVIACRLYVSPDTHTHTHTRTVLRC
eukprot:GHVR01189688.1.p1 GENE.GHVR01189688.1~~GHVR01189688.1.p1  ORF type:complete len:100 (-),score=56.08 GHVR01189688.1:37-336(-)